MAEPTREQLIAFFHATRHNVQVIADAYMLGYDITLALEQLDQTFDNFTIVEAEEGLCQA